jgi:hypothetical protein
MANAQKIGTVLIGDQLCDILKSERTGKYSVCAPNQMTPNFLRTQEAAIQNAQRIAGEAYNAAKSI